jgi:HEAT repeat protein
VSALLILTRLAGRSDVYHRAIVDADFAVELRDLLNHGTARVRSGTCHLLGKLCKDSSLFYGVLIQQLSPGPRPRPSEWQPPSVAAPRAGIGHRQLLQQQRQQLQLQQEQQQRRQRRQQQGKATSRRSKGKASGRSNFSPWSSSSSHDSHDEGSGGSGQGSEGESDAPSLADADVDSGRHDLLYHLIARCADQDTETRKNACFAIGNSAYHSDLLYADLGPAIPLLNALLGDEERKTRANAAGAIGNCVRNSGILCFDIVRLGAHERLVRLIESDPALQARRIALFSLGNLVVYKAGRDAVVRCLLPSLQGWLDKIGGQSSDAMIKTYAHRVSSKLALPALLA